jgi:23S rRNA pseudouridine2605 synthase
LQKFLADAGVASRRRAEELILAGRVLVNNAVVETLPAFVDPGADRVIADGQPVHAQRLEYFILNKPKGVVCTNRDRAGRRRAVELLPDLPMRLWPVGQLDVESSGLVLLTNDGELAERLTHARYGVAKTYHVEVKGRVPDDLPAQMKAGVFLAEGRAQASNVEVLHSSNTRSTLLVTLQETRNRQVRRMFARLGLPVRKLKRVQFGPLVLRELPLGSTRRLTRSELSALRAASEMAADAADARARGRHKRRSGSPPVRGERTARPKRGPGTAVAPSRRIIT